MHVKANNWHILTRKSHLLARFKTGDIKKSIIGNIRKISYICYMTIVVNPHSPQEEQALLAFLDSMKYDYSREDETYVLSEAQQKEILERDREYEAGETETYSIDEVIAHFNIKEK